MLDEAASEIRALAGASWRGEITAAVGMLMKARGLERRLSVGDMCDVLREDGTKLKCQVVAVNNESTSLMSFGGTEGVSVGSVVEYRGVQSQVRICDGWIGRVVNALGEPIDNNGPLPEGAFATPLKNTPPPAVARRRVGPALPTGVRAVDVFAPICRGQRMGVFAGSGVGKSTLLSMLARSSAADVNIIGLVGERGREVQEFLQRDLGESGLAKSIVIVATSDESPLARRQAAYLTLAAAEDQRKRGRNVFCMIDSVTRFAHALREIGLAVGEPPSARGYPPSVFAELAHLLERAGPGINQQGDITMAATILVDGDDHDEPIGDAVRGILDGHIVLDRKIAMRGRYPAMDILGSISRLAPDCYENEKRAALVSMARNTVSTFEDKQEIIQLGLYKLGADAKVDAAIRLYPEIENFLRQGRNEMILPDEAFAALAEIMDVDLSSSDETAVVEAPLVEEL
jgi:flagellum-specific ATP synthase